MMAMAFAAFIFLVELAVSRILAYSRGEDCSREAMADIKLNPICINGK